MPSTPIAIGTLRKDGLGERQATARLSGLSVSDKNELLFQYGINFNAVPNWQKRGIGLYWEDYEKPAVNPDHGRRRGCSPPPDSYGDGSADEMLQSVCAIADRSIPSRRKGMMGTSHDFTKYPRTPHLFGSTGTDDDKHLSEAESLRFVADESLIVEEKIDGTNVGIHFSDDGALVLQCRGHLITEGMHPQYDLFKQWAAVKRHALEKQLENRFILFGEWVYARHSVHYRQLTHYFFEFDIYDKQRGVFLDLSSRLSLIDGTGIHTVPVIHTGVVSRDDLNNLIGPAVDSRFDNPTTNRQLDGGLIPADGGGWHCHWTSQVRSIGVCGEDQRKHALAAPEDGAEPTR